MKLENIYRVGAIGTILSFGMIFVGHVVVFATLTMLFFLVVCYWLWKASC